MAYADKKNGITTGSFVGQWAKGKKKRRFETLEQAKDYEAYTRALGSEPPYFEMPEEVR